MNLSHGAGNGPPYNVSSSNGQVNGQVNPGASAFTNALAATLQNHYSVNPYAGGFSPHQLPNPSQFVGQFPNQFAQQIPGYALGAPHHAAQPLSASNVQPLRGHVSNDLAALGVSAATFSHQDENLLIKVLHARKQEGKTRRQALEFLHGVNSHSAGQWKDHYLEHGDRLDEQIVEFGINTSAATASKHTLTWPYQSRERSTNSQPNGGLLDAPHRREEIDERLPSSSPPAMPKQSRKPHSARPSHCKTPPKQSKPRRRKPRRAFSVLSDSKIPLPPSRSPSPPVADEDEDDTARRSYTDEELAFFIASIQWQLKNNPATSINELTRVLAEKVSRHSLQSWRSYFRDHRLLFNKLSSAAKGEPPLIDSDSDGTSYENQDDFHGDNEDGSGESSGEASLWEESLNESEGGTDSDEPGTEEDVSNMGKSGGPFTASDMRLIAKHIASVSNWHTLSHAEQWMPINKKYPQRSHKAWAEYHRRNEGALAQLVRRYRRKLKGKSKARASSMRSSKINDVALSEPEEDNAHTAAVKRKVAEGPDGADPISPENVTKRWKKDEWYD